MRAGFLKIHPDLVMRNLRIIDVDQGFLRQKVTNKGNSSRLAGIARVCLESKAKNCNALLEVNIKSTFNLKKTIAGIEPCQ